MASSLWLGLCGLGLTRPLLGSVLGLFLGSASVGLGLWLARPLLGSALCPVHAARPWLARPLLSCCWLLLAGSSVVAGSADWALWPLDWALWPLDVRAAVRWVLDVALLALISGSPCLGSTALGFAGLYWAVSLSLRTGLSVAGMPGTCLFGCHTGLSVASWLILLTENGPPICLSERGPLRASPGLCASSERGLLRASPGLY